MCNEWPPKETQPAADSFHPNPQSNPVHIVEGHVLTLDKQQKVTKSQFLGCKHHSKKLQVEILLWFGFRFLEGTPALPFYSRYLFMFSLFHDISVHVCVGRCDLVPCSPPALLLPFVSSGFSSVLVVVLLFHFLWDTQVTLLCFSSEFCNPFSLLFNEFQYPSKKKKNLFNNLYFFVIIIFFNLQKKSCVAIKW